MKMRKVMMTAILATITPILSDYTVGNGICKAEEGDVRNIPSWPDVAPVYDSFFDYSSGVLYIYGSLQYTVITVKVTHNSQTVVMDMLTPNDLPTQYDFNGCDSGSYNVTISAGITLLTSFSFNLI